MIAKIPARQGKHAIRGKAPGVVKRWTNDRLVSHLLAYWLPNGKSRRL